MAKQHAWLLPFRKSWKKRGKKRKTHAEHVEVKSSIQHIFDGRLPATALLDLKGPSSAKASIKKHSRTSNSNQSLLFLTAVKAFMLTRHRDQSFIHAFKRDWPVNEHVRAPAPESTPYLCQHTRALRLILPVILCVTPPAMHYFSANPTCTVYLCVCMHARRDQYIFRAISCFWLRCKHPFIQPIRGCHFIPMETCLGPNWQIDLHDFDYNFFVFVGLCLSSCVCLRFWVMFNESVLFCFCCFIPLFLKELLVSIFIISLYLWNRRTAALK